MSDTGTDTGTPASPSPDAQMAQWRPLAEKALKGQALESLTRQTADGLPVYPLYVNTDMAHPSARGDLSPRDAKRPWDLRVAISHPDPKTANALLLEGLMGGAASVHLQICPAGQNGIAVQSAQDMATVLNNLDLSLAPLSLEAGWHTPQMLAWAREAAGDQAQQISSLFSPVDHWLATGTSPGPLEGHILKLANLTANAHTAHAPARLLCAHAHRVHEAGGSEVQELATILATAHLYTQHLIRAGLSPEDALNSLPLSVKVDSHFMLGMAKLRALRTLWAGLCGGYGVDLPAPIVTVSSDRMLSAQDLETNILRLTAATFAAGVGGADSVITAPYTAPQQSPTQHPHALARRLARNTQLIAMEEAHLGRVADPAGGAYALEAMTQELAEAAWQTFQDIERQGGLITFIQSIRFSQEIFDKKTKWTQAIQDKQRKIIGVTVYKNSADPSAKMQDVAFSAPAHALSAKLPGPDSRCTALDAITVDLAANPQ